MELEAVKKRLRAWGKRLGPYRYVLLVLAAGAVLLLWPDGAEETGQPAAAAAQAARAGSLPQFLFLFEGERLRGYCFCIAEREGYSPALPWWAVHNADELPDELARPLLRAGAEVCRACGAAELGNRLREEEAARA